MGTTVASSPAGNYGHHGGQLRGLGHLVNKQRGERAGLAEKVPTGGDHLRADHLGVGGGVSPKRMCAWVCVCCSRKCTWVV